eukprot:CAMPEP_0194062240 /NCGR_PEP_ID=MMETSP0009_2-20130614/76947_1 /TAXON_ID=210454 /ORGANISM="Grammatophora oceanica, Strain CCMP 410" /LENGTH=46 /DNA_ID= /DNA_START= /DNA_END= /DNA_ORIENTATION=
MSVHKFISGVSAACSSPFLSNANAILSHSDATPDMRQGTPMFPMPV